MKKERKIPEIISGPETEWVRTEISEEFIQGIEGLGGDKDFIKALRKANEESKLK